MLGWAEPTLPLPLPLALSLLPCLQPLTSAGEDQVLPGLHPLSLAGRKGRWDLDGGEAWHLFVLPPCDSIPLPP